MTTDERFFRLHIVNTLATIAAAMTSVVALIVAVVALVN